MKNLVLGFLVMLFSSLSFGQTKQDLLNSKNPHNPYGESFYNFLKEVREKVTQNQAVYEVVQKEVNLESSKLRIDLTKEYVNENKLFFSRAFVDLKEIIKLENEIIENQQIKDKSGLLKYIALIKWTVFLNQEYTNGRERCYSCWEACTDRCMTAKLREIMNSNWIEQAAFVLTAAESTAIMYASCSWDCARNYNSH